MSQLTDAEATERERMRDAAPELYEALRIAFHWMTSTDNATMGAGRSRYIAAEEQVRAALAKADGR